MSNTITLFQKAKESGRPLALVTAYDATMAALAQAAGVDALLVGDSLGMVVQGSDNTLSVTLHEMIYHTKLVVRGAPDMFVITDLPFMSYQVSPENALRSAGLALKEGRAHAVKLEGGEEITPQVRALIAAGIPVMAHLGLQPQSIHLYGGYGKRGKTAAEQRKLLASAQALQDAGAFALVLENIPHNLAAEITRTLEMPTIGIGAGPACDGQVQVFHDLLGLRPGFKPRHAKRYTEAGRTIIKGLARFVQEVREGSFVSR
ncbi:MAG: 3-methyl-2-oxobutanoate hydroxymethyltransferase [Fidelibacterota bacterium]|nr:MAG: 3-methyl-2-oxobutanoate hydroxymethyltransferase [Candidatus Neomarinimicrobiota bacterium]